jgi:hypothetical protein
MIGTGKGLANQLRDIHADLRNRTVSGVSSTSGTKASATMDPAYERGKEEAPPTYQVEGASQFRLTDTPITRPADPRNTPTSV